MRITVDRDELISLLHPLVKVCSRRTPNPHFACVLMVAEKRKLRLTASDCEVWITRETDVANVHNEGSALIPAASLSAALGACSGPTVVLSVADDRMSMAGTHQKFTLNGYPSKNYPPVPKPIKGSKIDAAALRRALVAVSPMMTTSPGKYEIVGVGLMSRDGKLDVVAIDTSRMGVVSMAHKWAHETIVPPKSCAALASLLDECGDDEKVELAAERERVFASGESWSLSSVVVEGTFPPYAKVIPKPESVSRITVGRESLAAAVRGAGLTTEDFDPVVQFKIDPATKSARIASRAPDRGESRVDLSPDKVSGETIVQGYRPRYLLEALAPCGAELVEFCVHKNGGPATIREGDYLAVLMPREIDHPLDESAAPSTK